jgi:hypothetical protein
MVPVRAGAGADGGRAGVGVLRLRREGAGRMSYDVWVEVDAGGPEPIVVRDLNYTSNAWPLFGEVLGRSIRDLDGLRTLLRGRWPTHRGRRTHPGQCGGVPPACAWLWQLGHTRECRRLP